ncbi:DUF4097 family beta strand repeat-containing protein [Lewinella sp. 4G2]|uniref:DUF4097 family beta strand repeat-containing protein n=1 Tax=Lewinella sp. 4G2 TaxID=1803372 RepID=UPI0007B49544|nr:DUF4097 family beta strand repeat-containing protein [Lewinella sp. 4G2]OAV43463.1 hypothetical protein A3850_002660 [Lewinella sp. 4G2]
MSYRITSILSLLLAFALVGEVSAAPAGGWEKDYEKTFSESYDVNGQGSVRLENRYGEINVETWNENKVQIDVQVRVTASSQEKADAIFNRITINFSGGGNRATATTEIGQRQKDGSLWDMIFGNSISINWGDNSNDFKVYYNVKMPASASLETIAKYCDVRLPNLSGNNTTEVGYGDLVAGKLSGSNNVKISYGSIRADELGKTSSLRLRYSEADIHQADVLTYDGRYSELELGTLNRINVDAGYEEIEIKKVTEATLRGNYNDVEIMEVDELDVDGSYSDYSIGTIFRRLRADSNYGDIDVEKIGRDFEKIDVTTRYADVRLVMPTGRGYDVDVSARYGDVSVSGNGQLNRNKEGSSESIKGKISGTGTGRVFISTAYGDISLRQ